MTIIKKTLTIPSPQLKNFPSFLKQFNGTIYKIKFIKNHSKAIVSFSFPQTELHNWDDAWNH